MLSISLDDINFSKMKGAVYGLLDDTSAVLRLECSIDCISGSVGHQQNIFRSFSPSAFLLKKKFQKKII